MPKEALKDDILNLTNLKQQLLALLTADKSVFDRAALESVLTKRFFYVPSFQIYGGIAGLFDYGPPGSDRSFNLYFHIYSNPFSFILGCALQNNILSLWRQHFVLEEDMLEGTIVPNTNDHIPNNLIMNGIDQWNAPI